MKIYRYINEVKQEIHDIEVDSNTELRQKISGEDLITSRFTIEGSKIDLQIGDFVEFKNSVYTILDEPQVKKEQNSFTYNLQFKSDQYRLKNVQVINPETDESEFFLFGDAQDQLSVIIENLNRVYNTGAIYYADYIEETESRNISYNNENCLAALQRMASEFGCEFTVKGKKITFRKKIGEKKDLTLEYKKNLRGIERVTIQNAELLTVLYAYGAERNITNDYGSKRLKIAPISNNTELFGTIERSVNFDEIYPRYKGQVSAINTTDETWFKDTGIDFNIREQLMGGVTGKVVFNTGDLAGREFEIVDYKHTTKEVQIKRFTDDSDLTLPNNILKPRVGDKYVFVDIKMPQTYIDNAEAELLEKATEYLEKYSQPNVIYKIDPHFPALRKSNIDLNLGDIVTLKDDDFGIAFDTRILSLNQKINNSFDYAIEIGNQVTVSYLTKVLSDQKEIRNEVYYRDKYWSERFNRIFNNIENFKQAVYVNRGQFDPNEYYYNNENRVDYVYILDGDGNKLWYYFIGEDHTRGAWNLANWQFIGDSFEIIATETLLAENANIGDWIIQNGMIVSQSVYPSEDENEIEPTVQLNGKLGYMRFVTPKLYIDEGRYKTGKQVLVIDARTGEISIEFNGKKTTITGNGIAANNYGGNTVTDPFGKIWTAALIGNGDGSLPANLLLAGSPERAAGVVGIGKNNASGNKAPTYGGAFWRLKSEGRYVGVKLLKETGTYQVQEYDEILSCYPNGRLDVYLPQYDHIGRKIEVRRNAGDVHVICNNKILRGTVSSDVGIQEGDKWIFIWDGVNWLANYEQR